MATNAIGRGSILLAATLALTLGGLAGCGPDPEKAGDECDPDDGCPTGLVCAKGGEDHVCYIARGGNCDPSAPDLCVDESICTEKKICEVRVPAGGKCDPKKDECVDKLSCAELTAGGYACFPPVLVKGKVIDSKTKAGIAGANVLALDSQATAITDVAISDAKGDYVLDLPVPRGADGAPQTDMDFTLRASAADYQTFPGGIRTALPISTSETKKAADGWDLQTTLTEIVLIAVPADQKGLGSIAGKVVTGDDRAAGVLVVAEGDDGKGTSAISDKAGAYTIFNVPKGAYSVKGYAAGLQLDPAKATVAAAPLTGIDLKVSAAALGQINGSLSIVDAPGGSKTSVVLVVASTFNDTFVRGDVPRGLRAPLSGPPSVSGAFTIKDVPAGSYKVLAAFENDGLVRDPDPNIAGTQIVTVDMPTPGTSVDLSSAFKITEALAVIGPGKDDPEGVTAAPTLTWADDSSEDFYTVVVYNAYGDLVWCLSDQMMGCDGPNVPSVSGGGNVSVPYKGPLDPGMYYQFRATSWRSPGGNPGPISTTEDLRGVFFVTK